MTRRTLIAMLIAACALAAASSALAQSRSIEEGSVVRRQLLYRSDRLEVVPTLGHTLNDPYKRTLYLNVGLNYHLTNAFSLGLTAGYGLFNYNTNILDNIEEANPDVAADLIFSETTFVGNFHLGYVPFYGKFNFLDVGTVNWDFHLLAGVAGALISSDRDDLGGFKFGPAFGAGFRWFFDGDMAFSFDIVDRMYGIADVARGDLSTEEELSHNVMISLGVSFFVTGELRVSR